jgi:hypothetical protein
MEVKPEDVPQAIHNFHKYYVTVVRPSMEKKFEKLNEPVIKNEGIVESNGRSGDTTISNNK